MTTFQRGLIEKKIQTMEAGRFQELVLSFLPLYSPTYVGITRFGHTEFGKTRIGVPDLLKTLESGEQVGCECGTEERYWFPPEKPGDYPKWKPIEDAGKCLGELKKPIEIVLASSRPLSPQHPNAKSIIFDYLSTRTTCRLTLLSSEDISSWIESNLYDPKVVNFAGEFFPDAIELQVLRRRNDVLQAAIEQGERLGFPTKDIVRVIEASGILATRELTELVTADIMGDEHRFTLRLPGDFNGIKRIESRLPELTGPFGKIIQILGAPKIGKTNLCWESISLNKASYKWFPAPLDDKQIPEFIDAFLLALLSMFWSKSDVIRHLKGFKRGLLEASTAIRPDTSWFIVLDNTHLLPATQCKRLDETLRFLKVAQLLDPVAVVFISNRSLASMFSTITTTVVAPGWNAAELQQLVLQRNITVSDSDKTAYFQLLTTQSSGHPMFAAALAAKYSDRGTLVKNILRGPNVADLDLSAEIKSVLYQDILTTSDRQNFVQRLSVLNSKAPMDVLDAIRVKILPNIATTVPNLMDEIGPAVLEGSVEDGIRVSPTFRDVAKTKISSDETKATYRIAGKLLLKPKGKVIDGDRALDGIFYLLLAGDVGKAASWALYLLQYLLKDEENDPDKEKRLKIILDRLDYFTFVKPANDELGHVTLSALKLMLAHCHLTLKNAERAADILEDIDVDAVSRDSETPVELTEIKDHVRTGRVVSQLFVLPHVKDINAVIEGFGKSTIRLSANNPFSGVDDIFPEIIAHLPDPQLGQMDFERLSQALFPGMLASLFAIALRIGYKAKKNEVLCSVLDSLNESKDTAVRLFRLIARSSLLSETKQERKALEMIKEAECIIRDEKLAHDDCGPLFFQHKGDTLYQLAEFDNAIAAYERSLALLAERKSFTFVWNHYKIGLSSDEPVKAAASLRKAIEGFVGIENYKHASRALGALVAHMLNSCDYTKVLPLALQLADWFHLEQKADVAPALRLMSAHIVRVTHEIEGKTVPAEFPVPNPRHFLTLAEDLRPETGGVVTYEIMGLFAKSAKLVDSQKECFKRAIQAEATSAVDRQTIVMNWYYLLQVIEAHEVTKENLALWLSRTTRFQPACGAEWERFFFELIIRPFEERMKTEPGIWASKMLLFVEVAREVSAALDRTLSLRWRPYLAYAAGRCFKLLERGEKAYAEFREATRAAIECGFWHIGADSGFESAFVLGRYHTSLREAASAQYDLFLCLEGKGITREDAIGFGINLFRFWSKVEWRRLSEKDIRAKDYLLNVARRLTTDGFNGQEAAPILVSSLLKAFDHQRVHRDILNFEKTPPTELEEFLLR